MVCVYSERGCVPIVLEREGVFVLVKVRMGGPCQKLRARARRKRKRRRKGTYKDNNHANKRTLHSRERRGI